MSPSILWIMHLLFFQLQSHARLQWMPRAESVGGTTETDKTTVLFISFLWVRLISKRHKNGKKYLGGWNPASGCFMTVKSAELLALKDTLPHSLVALAAPSKAIHSDWCADTWAADFWQERSLSKFLRYAVESNACVSQLCCACNNCLPAFDVYGIS